MTQVTCRLTAKDRDQLRNPTLGNRVSATFNLFAHAQSSISADAGLLLWAHQLLLQRRVAANSSSATLPAGVAG